MIKTFTVKKEELPTVANFLLSSVMEKVESEGVFIALFGDLGAGKTAFVKEIAKLLGVEEEIISPTFILKKEYDVDLKEVEKLVHVDAYRFEKQKEGSVLHLDDDKKPRTLVFVEWPDKIVERVWDAEMHFAYVSEKERNIEVITHEKKH